MMKKFYLFLILIILLQTPLFPLKKIGLHRGKIIPSIALPDSQNNLVDIIKTSSNKPFIISFMLFNAKNINSQIKFFNSLQAKFGSKINIFLVSEDSEITILNVVKKNINKKIFLLKDPFRKYIKPYQIFVIPTVIFANKSAQLQNIFIELGDKNKALMIESLNNFLKNK